MSATPRPTSPSNVLSCAPPIANLEQTLRQRGMLINTVDLESFRERLRGANFYRNWRQSIGEEAWALMETKIGKVG